MVITFGWLPHLKKPRLALIDFLLITGGNYHIHVAGPVYPVTTAYQTAPEVKTLHMHKVNSLRII